MLTYKLILTADLIPYARNSRTHSEAQVTKIASSIKEFGFINPVVTDGKNGIVAGHGRVLAANKLGLKEVPCVEAAHLTEAQKRAYVIADNRMALDAGWDFEMLKVELKDLEELKFDLTMTGFDLGEMANIFLEKQTGETNAEAEWKGMPEFDAQDPCFRKIVVNFDSQHDVDAFANLLAQDITEKTKSIWFPEKERRDLESVRWADTDEE
jgi:hypothetical protein